MTEAIQSPAPWTELERYLEAEDGDRIRELFASWSETDRTHIASHMSVRISPICSTCWIPNWVRS